MVTGGEWTQMGSFINVMQKQGQKNSNDNAPLNIMGKASMVLHINCMQQKLHISQKIILIYGIKNDNALYI